MLNQEGRSWQGGFAYFKDTDFSGTAAASRGTWSEGTFKGQWRFRKYNLMCFTGTDGSQYLTGRTRWVPWDFQGGHDIPDEVLPNWYCDQSPTSKDGDPGSFIYVKDRVELQKTSTPHLHLGLPDRGHRRPLQAAEQ